MDSITPTPHRQPPADDGDRVGERIAELIDFVHQGGDNKVTLGLLLKLQQEHEAQRYADLKFAADCEPDGWFFWFKDQAFEFITDKEIAKQLKDNLDEDETCTEYFSKQSRGLLCDLSNPAFPELPAPTLDSLDKGPLFSSDQVKRFAMDYAILHTAINLNLQKLKGALAVPDEELREQLSEAQSKAEFYKRRMDLLQEWQNKMRDPERNIVCDILANGQTLAPAIAGNRYTLDPNAGEPVYAFRRRGQDDFCTCTEERYIELSSKPEQFLTTIFYKPGTNPMPSNNAESTARRRDALDMG